jgi:hypothetical protein
VPATTCKSLRVAVTFVAPDFARFCTNCAFVPPPLLHHDQYFAFSVLERPSSSIQACSSVQINKIKLLEQVAGSEAHSTTLHSNHAVYLNQVSTGKRQHHLHFRNHYFVLRKLAVAVLRPTNFQSMSRNDFVDAVDIPLVYFECDQNSLSHYQSLERQISELDLEMEVEIHKLRLPAMCSVIPITCRPTVVVLNKFIEVKILSYSAGFVFSWMG